MQITGTVQGSPINGKLPTKEATIAWRLASNPSIKGLVFTDTDGHYTIDIQVC
jgi:hypothetical protein